MKILRHNLFLVFFTLFISLTCFAQINSTPQTTQSAQPNLENIKRIARSVYFIQHQYYDPTRIKPREMLQEGFFELAKEIPEFLPRFNGKQMEILLGKEKLSVSLTSLEKLTEITLPVSQVFDFLRTNYKGKTKFEDMEYAFIGGMLSILDPHSNILPPKVYEEFKTQTQGEYGGLGIVIGIKENELTVISPIEDTPAFRAGIKTDDKIIQIDDQSTANMPLNDAVDLMRGPANTRVTLKLKTKNQGIVDVTLTREIIIIHSVESKLVKSKDGKKIGVIRIKGFQEDTYQDLDASLIKLKREAGSPLDGVVLDMRNNPGGLLDQAILVADRFLQAGDIVYTVGANNQEEEIATANKQGDDELEPMVVLINEGSASASEIVAGALKNNKRALLLGQKSFGKGSVQSLFNMRDGSSLKLTVAQYLTPGRESIQAVGIQPEIHIYPSLIGKDFFDLIEDEIWGEEKLDSHLDNTALTKKSTSLHAFSYLKIQDDKPEETESNYVSKIKEDDIPLQFAVKILGMSVTKSRDKVLSDLPPMIESEKKSEDQKLILALSQKSIDWTAGKSNTVDSIKLSAEFLNDKGEVLSALTGGQNVTLRVSASNNGSSPVYRVITTIESLNPLLNQKEFVFGKINPSETIKRDVMIKIPSEIISFEESISILTSTEETRSTPAKSKMATRFVEKNQPQFAYSYDIIDGGYEGTSGNQNKIAEPGETVALQVNMSNISTTTADKAVINLKNKEGKYVFLKKAREVVGVLKPGESAQRTMLFDVKPDFTKPNLSIEILLLDDETKSGLADTLTLAAATGIISNPVAQQKQITPAIQILPDTKRQDRLVRLFADINSEKPIHDITIFVKGKKIYYENLETGNPTTKKTLTQDLPLEKGVNSVVIQVRGDRDLQSQKTLSFVVDES